MNLTRFIPPVSFPELPKAIQTPVQESYLHCAQLAPPFIPEELAPNNREAQAVRTLRLTGFNLCHVEKGFRPFETVMLPANNAVRPTRTA